MAKRLPWTNLHQVCAVIIMFDSISTDQDKNQDIWTLKLHLESETNQVPSKAIIYSWQWQR